MSLEFSSLSELYNRVKPALHAKEEEFHRLGYSSIKSVDIWNYLIEMKWKKGKNLMLSDIVSDIMNLDCKEANNYLVSKIDRRSQKFDNLDII